MRAQARLRPNMIADRPTVPPGFVRACARRRPALCATGLLVAGLVLSACGQRGPLYLPADKQPPANTLTIQPAVQQAEPPVTSGQPTADDKPSSSGTPAKTGNN